MFREMRRKKQELSRMESVALLERATSGVLAVLGDGRPKPEHRGGRHKLAVQKKRVAGQKRQSGISGMHRASRPPADGAQAHRKALFPIRHKTRYRQQPNGRTNRRAGGKLCKRPASRPAYPAGRMRRYAICSMQPGHHETACITAIKTAWYLSCARSVREVIITGTVVPFRTPAVGSPAT